MQGVYNHVRLVLDMKDFYYLAGKTAFCCQHAFFSFIH